MQLVTYRKNEVYVTGEAFCRTSRSRPKIAKAKGDIRPGLLSEGFPGGNGLSPLERRQGGTPLHSRVRYVEKSMPAS